MYVVLSFALLRGLKWYSYFSKENQYGVCVFRRRQTQEQGHRGFRLSSLGIILAKSHRPRPWRHVKALNSVIDNIYERASTRKNLDITDEDWEPAKKFFEERKLKRADLGGAGDWTGWSDELDGVRFRNCRIGIAELTETFLLHRPSRNRLIHILRYTFLTSFESWVLLH